MTRVPRPCFLPIVDLRSGRTTDLELVSFGMLADAVEVAAACWAQRPDVGLLLSIELDAVDDLVERLDAAGADRARVAVEVPGTRLADAVHVRSLGLRLALSGLDAGAVDLGALCRLQPALVRVGVSVFRGAGSRELLAAGVGIGHTAGAAVVATNVDTPPDLRAAGLSGADAVQGLQAAPLLVGVERVLAHLDAEGIADPPSSTDDPMDRRLDQLARQAARVEALVGDVSDSVDRRVSSAGPRSVGSGPRGR